jgi:hypothetical protein
MERDYENIFDTEDLDPDELRRQVRETLRDNPSIDPDDINVHVRGDRVILTGRVGTDEAKRIAERVVADRIGLTNVESQLVVDEIRRPTSPEAADEHEADEQEHDGHLFGDVPLPFTDTSEHREIEQDGEYYDTRDRMRATEEAIPWSPPDTPTPEGRDETGIPHDAEQDSF